MSAATLATASIIGLALGPGVGLSRSAPELGEGGRGGDEGEEQQGGAERGAEERQMPV